MIARGQVAIKRGADEREAGNRHSMEVLQAAAESLEQALAWLARHVNVGRRVGTVRLGHADLELEDGALDAFLLELRATADHVRGAALDLAGRGAVVRHPDQRPESQAPLVDHGRAGGRAQSCWWWNGGLLAALASTAALDGPDVPLRPTSPVGRVP